MLVKCDKYKLLNDDSWFKNVYGCRKMTINPRIRWENLLASWESLGDTPLMLNYVIGRSTLKKNTLCSDRIR